ncbi:MAG: hypothetical protein AAGI68_06845 [Planctomycetota bacterium]
MRACQNILNRRMPCFGVAVFWLSLLVCPTGAWADELSAPDADAVDADASIDDLLGIPGDDKPGTSAPPAEGVDKPDDQAVELSDDLERRLDGAAAADVFDKAREGMGDVAVRLGEKLDGGKDTLREQDLILARLDQVIRSARQQQSSSSSSSQPSDGEPSSGQAKPKPGEKPAAQPGDQQQPGEKPGDGQQPAMAEAVTGGQAQGEGPEDSQPTRGQVIADGSGVSMKDLREGEWGNLPPRLRHELTESITEAFSPVYRRHTEAFYRRIAESLRENGSTGE